MLLMEGCCRYVEIILRFVLGLAFLCCHSTAVLDSASGDVLTYSVTEEGPPGTIVGNLALDAGLYRSVDLTQATFSIVNSVQNASNVFTVESTTAILKTKIRIDRDAICPQLAVCQFQFSIIVQSKDYFRVLKIILNIDDINDCLPTFTPSQFNLSISETSAVGEMIPLPTATDFDSPANGVESYALHPDQDPFRLVVRNISGQLDVRLNLTSMLDREQLSSYTLTLVAYDGGLPPKSGSLVVQITVADVNDNSPIFDNSTYEVHVPENTSVGSMILSVHATDRDAGLNGRVKYKFSQRSQNLYGSTFFLEPDSGNVILLQTLNAVDRSSYNLAILAVDQGAVPLSGSTALLIVVEQVNDRPPVINIDVLSDDGVASIPDTSPTGTFIAHVSVDVKGGQAVGCALNDTDNFQLVPLTVTNEFKVVTTRTFNAAETNYYVVVISCTENAAPFLSSAKSMPVFITPGPVLSSPVFASSIYSATVVVSAPPNTVVTTVSASVPSTVTRNVTIVYTIDTADTNKGFFVDSQTGVVKTLRSFGRELIGTNIVFNVTASYRETNVTAGISSSARVQVRVLDNGAAPPRFQQNLYSFSVLETADVGTAIGSVVATIPTADNISYHLVSLQGTSIVDLAVDENSGVIYTARVLVRDSNPSYGFQVVASNRRYVELTDTATVDVYVQANRPNMTYPGPGYNNTVFVSPLWDLPTLIATVAATPPQVGLSVCFSLRNYSEFLSIDAQSGELRVTANISQFSNHTLSVGLEVTVCGHPYASSSAVLYVTVVGERGAAPLRSTSAGSDSRVVILACVLAICFVLAIVMVVAIVLVCRRSRKRNSRASGGESFWAAVPIQAGTSSDRRSFSSRDGQHRQPMSDITLVVPPDVFKAIELEEADADSGCPSNSSSSQTSSDDGAAGVAGGGGPGATSRSGAAGADDSKRSFNSTDKNDGGSSASPVFVTPSSSHLYSSVVPNWLKSSSAALPLPDHAESPPVYSLEGPSSSSSNPPDKPLVLKPTLSRSGSLASRKSIRFAPDGSAIPDAKKKVHFAEQNEYLELNAADVTASSDITDLNDVSVPTIADDQDDVSDASSYADSETRRTVINTMANGGYANVPTYPPPGVTFGTFLPEDGSLV